MGDPAAAQAAVLAQTGHPEAPEAHKARQKESQDEVAVRQPVGVPRPQGQLSPDFGAPKSIFRLLFS